jgi:hypothetical protein
MPSEVLGVAPWVIFTAVVAWFASMFANRAKAKRDALNHADRLEVHRDELTFQLITSAKQEMSAARVEVDDLRTEVKNYGRWKITFTIFSSRLNIWKRCYPPIRRKHGRKPSAMRGLSSPVCAG